MRMVLSILGLAALAFACGTPQITCSISGLPPEGKDTAEATGNEQTEHAVETLAVEPQQVTPPQNETRDELSEAERIEKKNQEMLERLAEQEQIRQDLKAMSQENPDIRKDSSTEQSLPHEPATNSPGAATEWPNSKQRESPYMAASRLRAHYQPMYDQTAAEIEGAQQLLDACNHKFNRTSLELVHSRPAYKGTTDCNELPRVVRELEQELSQIEFAFVRECRDQGLHAKYCNLR